MAFHQRSTLPVFVNQEPPEGSCGTTANIMRVKDRNTASLIATEASTYLTEGIEVWTVDIISLGNTLPHPRVSMKCRL